MILRFGSWSKSARACFRLTSRIALGVSSPGPAAMAADDIAHERGQTLIRSRSGAVKENRPPIGHGRLCCNLWKSFVECLFSPDKAVFNSYSGKLVLMQGAGGIDDAPEVTLEQTGGQFAKSSTDLLKQLLRIIARRNYEDAYCQDSQKHERINLIHLPFSFREDAVFSLCGAAHRIMGAVEELKPKSIKYE
jgi:hypothetical protein